MMSYGQQTQELTITAFPLSQVVIALTMVVSAVLASTLSSGVLPRPPATTPGPATRATPMALCTGATTLSRSVLLSVASGIDYLTI